MTSVKVEVESLLQKLPDDCSMEDIQYHLYVMEKVRRGIQRAQSEGALSREDVQTRLN